MEIFGVGTPELIAILIIMLIVAGPKRMIQWAYTLGQYTAKLRRTWAEMMSYMQKEFEAAGMEVELPKEIPTRGTIAREIGKIGEKAVSPVTKPIQDTWKEASEQVKDIKAQTAIVQNSINNPLPSAPETPSNGKTDLGTWSDHRENE